MKKLLILTLCLILLPMVSIAERERQDLPPAPERAERITDKMFKSLDLSTSQKSAVYDINLEMAEAIDQAMLKTSKHEKRKAFRSAHKEKTKALKEVLSSEQFAKHQELEKQRQEKMKKKRAEKQ